MDWYVVVKTINGHRYRYRQKTWREGNRVRTQSVYLGRADRLAPTEADRDASGDLTLQRPGASQIKLDPAIVDQVLNELTGTETDDLDWEHGWSRHRHGASLVCKDRRIMPLLRTLKVKRTSRTSGAYYNPELDTVNIPPARCFEDKECESATQAYHAVLFHELVHWTIKTGRTGRGAPDCAKEELVAELGAIVLMKQLNISIGGLARHAKYFQIWLDRTSDQEDALAYAKVEAARAVAYILQHGMVTS